MHYFIKDESDKIRVSWNNLLNDLNDTTTYNPYCNAKNYYDVFRHIITSMIFDKEIILLDSDFTDTELVNLTGYSEYNKFTQLLEKDKFSLPQNKKELIDKLKTTGNGWKITLFTSGTTGIPKKITHDFNTITRFVKYYHNNKKSIWGFAYNPTHMAGVQVFLQALLNGNEIIRLFGLLPKEIYREIKENNITHISATPTFYRLLLPCNESFPSIIRITSGGEKFNEIIIKELNVIFPNVAIPVCSYSDSGVTRTV